MARCRVPAGLRWKLIVVANNCTDETEEVAAQFAARLPLVCLKEPRGDQPREERRHRQGTGAAVDVRR
jgi:glycosyltransferase involved in cell wall biosynthesis